MKPSYFALLLVFLLGGLFVGKAHAFLEYRRDIPLPEDTESNSVWGLLGDHIVKASERDNDDDTSEPVSVDDKTYEIDNRRIRGGFVTSAPLDEPHVPATQLRSWAALVVSDVMTFGFHDYRTRLSGAEDYFTEKGWENFSDALGRARIIEMVEANQQVVTAAPKGVPVIEARSIVNGKYQWTVQVPLVVTYQAGARVQSTNLLVTLVIIRSDSPAHPDGMAIRQWVAVPR